MPKILLIIVALIVICRPIQYRSNISQNIHNYCLMTHCNQQQWSQWSCKLCQTTKRLLNIKYIENKATQIMAVAGYNQQLDKLILIFRGTIDTTNWIQDFSYKQVAYKSCASCLIHQGFYLSYLSVSNQIFSALKQLNAKYPQKQLLVTGSSLGAALATVAAIQIHNKLQPVSELHTYGSPRVGNANLAMYIKTRIPNSLRVVHFKDIVPHVPLQSQNYHHIPYQIFFNEQMTNYQICSQNGEDAACSDSFYPDYRVQDHLTYWTKLDVKEIC